MWGGELGPAEGAVVVGWVNGAHINTPEGIINERVFFWNDWGTFRYLLEFFKWVNLSCLIC